MAISQFRIDLSRHLIMCKPTFMCVNQLAHRYCVVYNTHIRDRGRVSLFTYSANLLRAGSDMTRRTYKINEVAQALGLGRTTIHKLIRQGELQKIKLGRSTLISAESVDALLQRNAV
ncbi:MAG: helix-turn-helix domain-containing protein [Sphingomonadaceae bacterium]